MNVCLGALRDTTDSIAVEAALSFVVQGLVSVILGIALMGALKNTGAATVKTAAVIYVVVPESAVLATASAFLVRTDTF